MNTENAKAIGLVLLRILRAAAGLAGVYICWQIVVLQRSLVDRFTLLFSWRFFTEYRFDVVVAGGALDQSGLTKLLFLVLVLEFMAALAGLLCRLVSESRVWRGACAAVLLPAFAMPVALSALFTWELSRYIAVMGLTANRAAGIVFAALVFFAPAFCAVKWIAGPATWAQDRRVARFCLAVSLAAVVGIGAAAAWSVVTHPRPTVCQPNGVDVPPA